MAKSSVTMELAGDAKGIVRALARSEKEVDKLKGKLKEAGGASAQAGKAGQTAFGGNALAGIKRYAAGFISVGAAIGVATKALRSFHEERMTAMERITAAEGALKSLIQISGGDPKRFEQYIRTAQALTAQGVEPGAAYQAVFTGYSLGFGQEAIQQAGTMKAFTRGIEPLLQAVGGVRAAFGPAALGGGLESGINALLAGAEKTKVNLEQLSEQILIPAQPVVKLGGTAVETIAAVATIVKGLPSPERAATAVARAADIMAREDRGLKGRGLLGAIRHARGLSEDQLTEFIGENIRAERGIRLLIQNFDTFVENIDEINKAVAATGKDTSRVRQAVQLAGIVEPVSPLLKYQRAKAGRAMAEEEAFGVPQLERAAIRDAMMRILTEQKVGWLGRWTMGAEMGLRDLFNHEPAAMLRAAERMITYTRPDRPGYPARLPGTQPGDTAVQLRLHELAGAEGRDTELLRAAAVDDAMLKAAQALDAAADKMKAATQQIPAHTTLAAPDMEPP